MKRDQVPKSTVYFLNYEWLWNPKILITFPNFVEYKWNWNKSARKNVQFRQRHWCYKVEKFAWKFKVLGFHLQWKSFAIRSWDKWFEAATTAATMVAITLMVIIRESHWFSLTFTSFTYFPSRNLFWPEKLSFLFLPLDLYKIEHHHRYAFSLVLLIRSFTYKSPFVFIHFPLLSTYAKPTPLLKLEWCKIIHSYLPKSNTV